MEGAKFSGSHAQSTHPKAGHSYQQGSKILLYKPFSVYILNSYRNGGGIPLLLNSCSTDKCLS